jgi:hypothetical protein
MLFPFLLEKNKETLAGCGKQVIKKGEKVILLQASEWWCILVVYMCWRASPLSG